MSSKTWMERTITKPPVAPAANDRKRERLVALLLTARKKKG